MFMSFCVQNRACLQFIIYCAARPGLVGSGTTVERIRCMSRSWRGILCSHDCAFIPEVVGRLLVCIFAGVFREYFVC